MNDHRSSKQPWLVANDQRMLLRSFSGIYLYVDARDCRWSSHDSTNKTSLLRMISEVLCLDTSSYFSNCTWASNDDTWTTFRRWLFCSPMQRRRPQSEHRPSGVHKSVCSAFSAIRMILVLSTQSCICRLDAEKPHVEATWDPCEQQPTASSFLLFSLDLFLVSLRIISSLAAQEDVIYRVWMID